jgi:hypothetical protein
MEFFIPWWGNAKLIAAAIAGGLVLAAPAYLYGSHKGAVAERTAIEGEIAKRTAELLKQRAKDDAEIRNLDDRALCLELLPDGVPDSACD